MRITKTQADELAIKMARFFTAHERAARGVLRVSVRDMSDEGGEW